MGRGLTALALALVLALPVLAGCIGGDGEANDAGLEQASSQQTGSLDVEALWAQDGRNTIVDHTADVMWEADVACQLGGGPQLPREGGLIAPETGHLEVLVALDPTVTGLQVGYVVDGTDADYATGEEKEITWLPAVQPGQEQTFEVEVPTDQVETTEKRWSWYYQINPGAEQACYSGAASGEYTVSVVAIRG